MINRVEGLELTACAAIKLGEGHADVDFGNYCFSAAVAVCVAWEYLAIIAQEYIVNTPSVDCKAFYTRITLKRCVDTEFYIFDEGRYIPCKMSVNSFNGVGKTIYFFRANLSVFLPADNMTA